MRRFQEFLVSGIVSTTNPDYMQQKADVLAALASAKATAGVNACDAKLHKIYDTLFGSFAKLRLPKEEMMDLHKHVYAFFHTAVGIGSPARHYRFYATRWYEDFAQGIRMYEHPSHHRLDSFRTKGRQNAVAMAAHTS